MPKTRTTHLRDTRANQPTSGLITGTIYYVTDENVTERWNGATWEDITDAGGGGSSLNQADILIRTSLRG